jgi:hypothetical protein
LKIKLKVKNVNIYLAAIFFSIISQLPFFVEGKISSYFGVIWLFPLFVLFYKGQFQINSVIFSLFISIFLLILFVTINAIYTNSLYLSSPHLVNILKSAFILVLSYNFAYFIELESFSPKLGIIALVTGFALDLGVYNYLMKSEIDIQSREYAYGAKNSISQIILTCMILTYFLGDTIKKFTKIKYFKILNYLFLTISLVVLFFLKSRATIFALLFIPFIIGNRSAFYPKLKLFTGLLITIFVLYFFEDLRNLLFINILLGGRDINDLNDASSGRVDFFEEFPILFKNHVFLGNGYIFSESFPLSVLLDYGIIGGFCVFYFFFTPIFFFVKFWSQRNNNFVAAFLAIVLVYYFNSLFEQQAPFGPGTKNLILWALFGMLLNKHFVNHNILTLNSDLKSS